MNDFIETMNGSFIRKSDIKQVYIRESHGHTAYTPMVRTIDSQHLTIGKDYTTKSKAKMAVDRFMAKYGLIKEKTK